MNTQHHAPMHEEHSDWVQDVKSWQEDIDHWRQEQSTLKADAESALGIEEAWLNDHAASIASHEQRVLRHEHTIAELERMRSADPMESNPYGLNHRRETEAHVNLRLMHERLKCHHHQAMAKLAALRRAMGRGF